MDDREADCEDEGAQCDDESNDESDDDTVSEPSLGWPERDSQRLWDAFGDHSDRQVSEWRPSELDTADILAACVNCVPVNARVDQAIAAHRIAFEASQRDPEAQRLAEYALHAVVMARTLARRQPRPDRLPRDFVWGGVAEWCRLLGARVPGGNIGDDSEADRVDVDMRLIRRLLARFRLRLGRWMIRASAKLAEIGAGLIGLTSR
jgi:hypothetical protein